MSTAPNPRVVRDQISTLDRPYLRVALSTLFVRDQDRSLAFFRDLLGFTLVGDSTSPTGERWLAVAAPDGTAILELITPSVESPEHALIGRLTRCTLVTNDIDAVFLDWSARGLAFDHPPVAALWGGALTRFRDPDGNTITLASFDDFTRELEEERQHLAARQEASRRAAQEREIARTVQARLLPQSLPRIAGIDLAGLCLQSRDVGGDYFDFLELGPHRLGLIIGDVAGKGIAAALLMVSLQATIRSQLPSLRHGAPAVLELVNQRFFEDSLDSAYATLLIADYHTTTRELRFCNCGHLPGLLLRPDPGTGIVEIAARLDPTATVLGLFPTWHGQSRTVGFNPGDILLLYTDGVTESLTPAGEEFGEAGLLHSARQHAELPAQQLLEQIRADLAGPQQSLQPTPEQHDDFTLIVVKALA